MKASRWISLLAMFVVGCLVVPSARPLRAQGVSPAGPPAVDAEGLARLAPRLDSRRADVRSFEVKGFMAAAPRWTFHCVSADPQRACAVLLDQVPIFLAAGDQVLLYDVLSGPHLWRADWRFFLGIADDRLSLFSDVLTRSSVTAGVLIDLPSILQVASERRMITLLGGQQYLLTAATRSGGSLDAWIDLSRPGRYSRLTARERDEERPLLDVSIVSVDEPIAPRAFAFPRFADHLQLPAPTEMTLENMGEGLKQIGTELFFHVGLADVMKRSEMEQKLGHPLDWTGLQEREARIAPLLRQAIETDSDLRAP